MLPPPAGDRARTYIWSFKMIPWNLPRSVSTRRQIYPCSRHAINPSIIAAIFRHIITYSPECALTSNIWSNCILCRHAINLSILVAIFRHISTYTQECALTSNIWSCRKSAASKTTRSSDRALPKGVEMLPPPAGHCARIYILSFMMIPWEFVVIRLHAETDRSLVI